MQGVRFCLLDGAHVPSTLHLRCTALDDQAQLLHAESIDLCKNSNLFHPIEQLASGGADLASTTPCQASTRGST